MSTSPTPAHPPEYPVPTRPPSAGEHEYRPIYTTIWDSDTETVVEDHHLSSYSCSCVLNPPYPPTPPKTPPRPRGPGHRKPTPVPSAQDTLLFIGDHGKEPAAEGANNANNRSIPHPASPEDEAPIPHPSGPKPKPPPKDDVPLPRPLAPKPKPNPGSGSGSGSNPTPRSQPGTTLPYPQPYPRPGPSPSKPKPKPRPRPLGPEPVVAGRCGDGGQEGERCWAVRAGVPRLQGGGEDVDGHDGDDDEEDPEDEDVVLVFARAPRVVRWEV